MGYAIVQYIVYSRATDGCHCYAAPLDEYIEIIYTLREAYTPYRCCYERWRHIVGDAGSGVIDSDVTY